MSTNEWQARDQGIVAHTLVAAHADRVRELARLYGLLDQTVASSGANGAATREAYGRLMERMAAWEIADWQTERLDIVTLAGDEREALRQDTARAIAYAEILADGLHSTAREHAIVRSLQRVHADFPKELTRAALVRVRRSRARLTRLEELKGPMFVLGGEAAVLLGALETASAPNVQPEVVFDNTDGFASVLMWGLELCVIEEPGATGAVDVGLGTSPAVAVLGVSGETIHELYERWLRFAEPTHPLARYPYVPRGRFCTVSATRAVRCDLESTGPIGWAAGDDVAIIARDLLAIAGEQPRFATDLHAVANRVASAAQRGEAVIGCIECLPREAEGRRQWLVDAEADGIR